MTIPTSVRQVEDWDFIEHIKARGVEAVEKKSIPGHRARRLSRRTNALLDQPIPQATDSLGEEGQ